jgi:hypothetical protein
MKRWPRISWLHWLALGGFNFPGMGYPEMRALLDSERQQAKARAREPVRSTLPPPHGPERLVTPVLSEVEQELWRCIQGEHGAACGGSS